MRASLRQLLGSGLIFLGLWVYGYRKEAPEFPSDEPEEEDPDRMRHSIELSTRAREMVTEAELPNSSERSEESGPRPLSGSVAARVLEALVD